jgi:hypothetical protein
MAKKPRVHNAFASVITTPTPTGKCTLHTYQIILISVQSDNEKHVCNLCRCCPQNFSPRVRIRTGFVGRCSVSHGNTSLT